MAPKVSVTSSLDVSGVLEPKTSKTKDDNKNLVICLEFSCGDQNQAENLANALKEKGVKVYGNTFIKNFWRVKFEQTNTAYRIAENLITDNPPIMQSSSTISPSSTFFPNKQIISTPVEKVMLFEGQRKTKAGHSCYELSCKTAEQNENIQKQLRNCNVDIIETMFYNEAYRIKIPPTQDALMSAKDIVDVINNSMTSSIFKK